MEDETRESAREAGRTWRLPEASSSSTGDEGGVGSGMVDAWPARTPLGLAIVWAKPISASARLTAFRPRRLDGCAT